MKRVRDGFPGRFLRPGLVLTLGTCLGGCLLTGGGGGSEDTNGSLVTGILQNPDGSPAQGVRIQIRSSDYLRDLADTSASGGTGEARTDARGAYHIRSLSPGSYTLEARDDSARGASLHFDFQGRFTALEKNTLHPLGALQGKLEARPGMDGPAYVQVYGFDRVAWADSGGAFSIPGLAPGHYRLRAVSSLPGTAYRQPGPVLIAPGDTLRLAPIPLDSFTGEDYDAWPFSRTVLVKPAAAGIQEGVGDFPLLIRLTSATFDFSLSDGKDFRFAGPGGRPLPYEVDRWEVGSKLAEIWVHLDSLPSGGASFPITMYWGKRDAPDFSDGRSVFPSFAASWHMREAINSSTDLLIRDASPSQAHAQGHFQAGLRKAVWGYGGLFQGSHFVRATGHPALKPETALTLSAWVLAGATDSFGAEIMSMGDNYGLRIEPGGGLTFFALDDTTRIAGTAADAKVSDGAWHHVAGVFDGSSLRVYLDGRERAAVPFSGPIAYSLGTDFWIGKHGNGQSRYDFTGRIDEAQVSPSGRSPAWIRLAYENQRPGSVLLEFR